MPFDAEQLMAYSIPEAKQTLTKHDCMLYALGVGVGDDPTDENQLKFVYEASLRAMPTMANVLAHPGFWMKAGDTGMDWRRILHGEQKFTIHRPLPVEGRLVGHTRVKAIQDRGEDKGAWVYLERRARWRGLGAPFPFASRTTYATYRLCRRPRSSTA